MFPLTGRIIYALPPIFSLIEKDCTQQESNNSSSQITVDFRERLQHKASAFLLMSELHHSSFAMKVLSLRPSIPVAAEERLLLSIDAFLICANYKHPIFILQHFSFRKRSDLDIELSA